MFTQKRHQHLFKNLYIAPLKKQKRHQHLIKNLYIAPLKKISTFIQKKIIYKLLPQTDIIIEIVLFRSFYKNFLYQNHPENF